MKNYQNYPTHSKFANQYGSLAENLEKIIEENIFIVLQWGDTREPNG